MLRILLILSYCQLFILFQDGLIHILQKVEGFERNRCKNFFCFFSCVLTCFQSKNFYFLIIHFSFNLFLFLTEIDFQLDYFQFIFIIFRMELEMLPKSISFQEPFHLNFFRDLKQIQNFPACKLLHLFYHLHQINFNFQNFEFIYFNHVQ